MYRSLIAGLGLLTLTATTTFAATTPALNTAPTKPALTSVAPVHPSHVLSVKPTGKMHRIARTHTPKAKSSRTLSAKPTKMHRIARAHTLKLKPSSKPAKTAG